MISGLRLWTSVTLMFIFIGTAMISWRQMKFSSNFQSELSADEWAPIESQKQWQTQSGYSEDQSADQSDDEEDGVSTNAGEMADFREPKDGSIKSISLLGERNSGTRWIYG